GGECRRVWWPSWAEAWTPAARSGSPWPLAPSHHSHAVGVGPTRHCASSAMLIGPTLAEWEHEGRLRTSAFAQLRGSPSTPRLHLPADPTTRARSDRTP